MFRLIFFAFILMFMFTAGCKKEDQTATQPPANEDHSKDNVLDVDAKGIPRFVSTDYIELDKISSISKFRSSVGHDYSDSFESCRSMKHYFMAKPGVDWSAIKICSPAEGTILKAFDEWAGTQLQIKSKEYPAILISIFHIRLSAPLKEGDAVHANQQLGFHIGSQTMSDIAVGVNTPKGWKLVSYFEIMTDALFKSYQSRGLNARSEAMISKELRDSDPLNCSGESFSNSGKLENWITLN